MRRRVETLKAELLEAEERQRKIAEQERIRHEAEERVRSRALLLAAKRAEDEEQAAVELAEFLHAHPEYQGDDDPEHDEGCDSCGHYQYDDTDDTICCLLNNPFLGEGHNCPQHTNHDDEGTPTP